MELDIQYKKLYIQVASQNAERLKTLDLKKFEKTGNIAKLRGDNLPSKNEFGELAFKNYTKADILNIIVCSKYWTLVILAGFNSGLYCVPLRVSAT